MWLLPSYLALPLLLTFGAVRFLRVRRSLVLQNFVIALAGMLLVLTPFVAYGLRYGNYIATRPNHVSLLTGVVARSASRSPGKPTRCP